MATLEDIQAELARRSGGNQDLAPISARAPVPAPEAGTTVDDIKAELARRAAAPEPQAEPTSRPGLAARAAIQGGTSAVLGLPALLQDAATGPVNLMYMGQNYLTNKLNQLAGTNIPQAKLIPSALTAVNQLGQNLADVAGTPQPQAEPTSRSGLAARAAIQGGTSAVLGLPALLQDAATGPVNLMYMGQNYLTNKLNQLAGTNIPQAKLIPSALTAVNQLGQNLADVAGTPQPQTPGEKAAVNIGSTALGALGPGGYGRLLSRAPSAMAQTVGSQMAATPILDVASAATGEAAKQAIEQKGGGAGAATVGGLAASMLPYAGAVAGRRVITPVPSQLTPEQQKLAQTLREAGVPLSAGQATGSKNLQFVEDQAAKLPLGELLVKNPTAGQQQAFTTGVLKKAGINETAATPEVLAQAHKDIGRTIGDITSQHTVQFDPQYATDIYSMLGNYGKNLSTDQKNTIASYISDLKDAGSRISGEVYQKTRSNIGRAIRAQNGVNGDKEYQGALIGLQNALDDAAQRSMMRAGAQDSVEALQTARQQYANLMVIEDAVARSGQAGASGQINASALSAAAKSAVGKRQYARGVGDLNELSRAGDAFVRPLADTTTARRNALLGLSAMAGSAYPTFGPLGAAAVMGAPALASGALNNPLIQRWLRNQALPGRQQIPLGAIPGLLGQ